MTSIGAQIIYNEATGLEKAMADVDADRVFPIGDIEIVYNWDPYKVHVPNLPYLAFGMGVTFWEDDYWSTSRKRQWVADQWLYKSLRGTVAGIRMALSQNGYTLKQYINPPQGYYASPILTPEQWNSWIRLMPELRIFRALREGTHGLDEFFVDYGFVDQDAVSIDDGFALRGKYAVIRHLGVDTPLAFAVYEKSQDQRVGTNIERLSTNGLSTIGFFAGIDFSDDDSHFIDFEEVVPQIYTIHLDRSYSIDTSTARLSTVAPSLEPLSPSFTTDSDVGYGNGFMFVGDNLSSGPWNIVDYPDGGDKLLAERIYLHDPTVAGPMTQGVSFVGLDRIGMPTYTIELLVDLNLKEARGALFVDEAFVFESFSVPEDLSHFDRALRSIVDAKALRDTALVDFAPKRPLALDDVVSENTRYGEWVKSTL